EVKEISVFPDGMFKFASVETGIILGRKHEKRRTIIPSHILFRRVRESKIQDFRDRYLDSWKVTVTADWLISNNDSRLVVPELRGVWDACDALRQLRQLAF